MISPRSWRATGTITWVAMTLTSSSWTSYITALLTRAASTYGLLAARLAGHAVDRVLVDVSPYSFGPSYFGLLHGVPSEHCYRPIIHRNTPLPVSRTESYFTMVDGQQAWEVSIYQGEDPHALNNI